MTSAGEPEGGGLASFVSSKPTTECDGTVKWRTAFGKVHRTDGPAVIYPDGSQEWWQHGVLHRVDGPAVIRADGRQYWLQFGQHHRLDGPAAIHPEGHEVWRQRGKLHRTDGPAITWSDGTLEWWENDERKPPEIEEMLTMVWRAQGETP